ncbi:glutaredoxin family protein [Bifidobacterium crudilactis]|jgi:glutaredoxin-like protein NrdH|uniref:glutaredoxin family protein n=1 Tax=Bifidobacterium crudilactis TaxID=327277 RepID=UPI002356FCA5|nr:glutaredoxin family protein [Bifidobacterium crudilactis]MCI1218486.1 glutaredoxin family protein [Bifidobacterium crudilactis]
MTVKIYTTPGCPQCRATKRRLDARGVAYIEYDVSTDPWADIEAGNLGYKSTPVVVTDTTSWSGYRPDLID